MKVCVIGAGAAGLCAGRHVLAAGLSLTLLEHAPHLGGTWVYTEQTGSDQHGLPIHTSMYKSLRTNLPKEIMGFPDFPIPESNKSFLPAKDILAFLQSYSDHFDVTRHVQLNHFVKNVKPVGDGWEVQYENLTTRTETTGQFGAVMVCNGHYNTPYIPKIQGIETFEGDTIHSHDYRVPEVFSGKKVLVVGAGPSGLDIAAEICSTAEKVFFSHHLKEKPQGVFQSNLDQKPDVKEIQNSTIIFTDETTEEVDTILFCTGYVYNFPFLHHSCGISVDDNFVQPLYKHMINIEHPTMCLVGIPFYVCIFPMFDIQARFFIKFLQGLFSLPSKEKMYENRTADIEKRREKCYTNWNAHLMGTDQSEYYEQISSEAGIEPIPPVLAKIFNQCVEMFFKDIVHFRKYLFKVLDRENFIHSLEV